MPPGQAVQPVLTILSTCLAHTWSVYLWQCCLKQCQKPYLSQEKQLPFLCPHLQSNFITSGSQVGNTILPSQIHLAHLHVLHVEKWFPGLFISSHSHELTLGLQFPRSTLLFFLKIHVTFSFYHSSGATPQPFKEVWPCSVIGLHWNVIPSTYCEKHLFCSFFPEE